MKMDHDAFRTALARQPQAPADDRLGVTRLAAGALFLIVAPLLILGSLLLVGAVWALSASAILLRDCVVYATEVTVGRPAPARQP